jgi:hypothetical protein
MSILDGQFFFAEKNKKKVDNTKKILNKLETLNLPQELKDKLKGRFLDGKK